MPQNFSNGLELGLAKGELLVSHTSAPMPELLYQSSRNPQMILCLV